MFKDGGWMYAAAKLAAAKELANRPDAQYNSTLQNEICREYGIFLDNMTDDEISEFEHLIQSYC